MSSARNVAGLAIGLLVHAGCGASTDDPGGPTRTMDGGFAMPPPAPVIAYVSAARTAIRNSGSVAAFRLDPASEEMTPVAGSPFGVGGNPGPAAFDPQGRFAYVPNTCTSNVSGFEVDTASGAFRELSSSPTTANVDGPVDLMFHRTARVAYVSVVSSPCRSTSHRILYVKRYDVNAETGGLAAREALLIGEAGSIEMHPSRRFFYGAAVSATTSSGEIRAFRIEDSGEITPAGAVPIDSAAGTRVRVEPRGEFLLTNRGQAYRIDPATGALRLAGQAEFLHARCCPAMAVAPDGNTFYVSGEGVESLALDRATGAVRYVSGVLPGPGTSGLQVHPSGRWLLSRATRSVDVYPVDPVTGALGTSMATARLDTLPGGGGCFAETELAIDSSGTLVAVPSCLGRGLRVYNMDPRTGVLREWRGSPLATDEAPRAVVLRAGR